MANIPPRLTWAAERLDLRPDDRLLEIGCGRGVLAALVCEKLKSGRLTAIDRSDKAIDAAMKLNRAHIDAGRAEFRELALEDAAGLGERFPKIFAFNVNAFWMKPEREIDAVKKLLSPDGVLYLFYDPPSDAKIAELREKLPANLSAHGFVLEIYVEKIETGNVLCAVCRSG